MQIGECGNAIMLQVVYLGVHFVILGLYVITTNLYFIKKLKYNKFLRYLFLTFILSVWAEITQLI
jgi:hypothetical protein